MGFFDFLGEVVKETCNNVLEEQRRPFKIIKESFNLFPVKLSKSTNPKCFKWIIVAFSLYICDLKMLPFLILLIFVHILILPLKTELHFIVLPPF